MSEDRPEQRYPRVNVWIPVRLSSIDPEFDPADGRPCFRSSEETVANLSRGGAFVATSDPVTPGRRVLLEFEMPEGPLQAVARVRWSRARWEKSGETAETGIGLEFLGGPHESLETLEAFLARRLRGRRRQAARAPQLNR